jgi:hypothetical protein
MPFASLTPDGRRIAVHTVYAERDMIRMVPGIRFDSDAKAWSVPLSWAACIQLRAIFGPKLQLGTDLQEWAWREKTERVDIGMYFRDKLTIDGAEHHSTWRPYQLADVQFLLLGDCLLANEPGTGKTVSVLTAARTIHLTKGGALPMLVICPNSVKHHWADHVPR